MINPGGRDAIAAHHHAQRNAQAIVTPKGQVLSVRQKPVSVRFQEALALFVVREVQMLELPRVHHREFVFFDAEFSHLFSGVAEEPEEMDPRQEYAETCQQRAKANGYGVARNA